MGRADAFTSLILRNLEVLLGDAFTIEENSIAVIRDIKKLVEMEKEGGEKKNVRRES